MAAVGGVGYYAGRKKAQAEAAQDDRAQADAAQAEAAQAEAAAKAQAEQAEDDDIERLKKLAELRDSGVLTQEEFEQEKKKILAAG